jgi:hypothetical protein
MEVSRDLGSYAKQSFRDNGVPKQELGNQPFMGLRPTQNHETGGTGFPSYAWTPEGGSPTLSEQKKMGSTKSIHNP